jgi:hypothetical protein
MTPPSVPEPVDFRQYSEAKEKKAPPENAAVAANPAAKSNSETSADFVYF